MCKICQKNSPVRKDPQQSMLNPAMWYLLITCEECLTTLTESGWDELTENDIKSYRAVYEKDLVRRGKKS